MEHFIYKDGVASMGIVPILIRLKEELAWATDKRLQIISNLKQLYRQGTKE